MVDERIVYNHLGSLRIEGEFHFLDAFFLHRRAHCILTRAFGIKKQKPSAARPGNFSAEGSPLAGHLVEAVDPLIGDARGDALLSLPGVVEQMAEVFQVSAE